MKLRNHPLMFYRGISTWPPIWVQSRFRGLHKKLSGEIGVLKQVHLGLGDRSPRCYLVIEHDRERYVGTLLFDDPAFCFLLISILAGRIGWSIEAIGDMDLSYTH